MSEKGVLVAMSGGVDSSVAAALLIDAGYRVQGATMIMSEQSKGAVSDAKAVCDCLGIKHHVIDLSEIFKKCVVQPFIDDYMNGRTPNPCVNCNRNIKFGPLLEFADGLGFDYIATGHYANISREGDRYTLRRAATYRKDQTYVLYNLTQTQLARLLLPIGGMTKQAVREYARARSLPVFDKPDSQEICFIPDNDYAGFISRAGYSSKPGRFIDKSGNMLGSHPGTCHYTIGQRKGLGGGFEHPMYVVAINAENGDITLGGNEDTLSSFLTAHDMGWTSVLPPTAPFECDAAVRYNGGVYPAVVYPEINGVRVEFKTPARAVTPGQSVVFYNGDLLLGGGVID